MHLCEAVSTFVQSQGRNQKRDLLVGGSFDPHSNDVVGLSLPDRCGTEAVDMWSALVLLGVRVPDVDDRWRMKWEGPYLCYLAWRTDPKDGRRGITVWWDLLDYAHRIGTFKGDRDRTQGHYNQNPNNQSPNYLSILAVFPTAKEVDHSEEEIAAWWQGLDKGTEKPARRSLVRRLLGCVVQ